MYRFTEIMDLEDETYYPEDSFSREQMNEIYNKNVNHTEYPAFENWMSDMRRSENVIQDTPMDTELAEYAKWCAKRITIRYCTDDWSEDETRESSEEESKILFKVIYGTLLGVRDNHDATMRYNSSEFKYDSSKAYACISVGEYVLKMFLPSCNVYSSLFFPVSNFYEC